MHYSKGLIVGRFQPFHNGHAYLIKRSLEIVDTLIIAIGSVNKVSLENPWDFSSRKKMIEHFLHKEGLQDKVDTIIPLADMPSDAQWLKTLLVKTGEIDVVIGNNDWVNGIFAGEGYKTYPITYYKRFILEGTKIRRLIQEQKPWEERVPPYLVSEIKNGLSK